MHRAVWLLLLLAACDRAPQSRDLDRMGIDNPGRTDANDWVVGSKALNIENAETDARKQVSRGNCRVLAYTGEGYITPGYDKPVVNGMIIVGDTSDVETPEVAAANVRAQAYGERYNAVLLKGCT